MSANVMKKKKRKKFTWRSDETRRRAAEAGRRNLLAYRASVGGKTHVTHGASGFISAGSLPPEIAKQVEEFGREILGDLGRKPNARELALITSTKIAYSILLLASTKLRSLRRFSRNKWLLSVLATYQNVLRLNLEVLGGRRNVKKLENTLPSAPDDRAEAERIVQEFVAAAKGATT